MINFEEMNLYLEARKNKRYFIPPAKECSFDHSTVQILAMIIKDFGAVEVAKCFESNGLGKSAYPVELPCANCCAMFYVILSKTSFMDVLKGGSEDDRNFLKFECEQCKSQSDAKKTEESEREKEERIKIYESNTNRYIENYLNPNRQWNAGVKTYEKWNSIIQYGVDEQKIASHIKGMPYYDFLKTPYWKAISEKKRGQAKFKCQLCNCEGKLATHHRTYDSHGFEHCHLQDLIVLCDGCHTKFHDKEPNGNT